jgi:hypothetical protein
VRRPKRASLTALRETGIRRQHGRLSFRGRHLRLLAPTIENVLDMSQRDSAAIAYFHAPEVSMPTF